MGLRKMLKGAWTRFTIPVEVPPLSTILKAERTPRLEEAIKRLEKAKDPKEVQRARAQCMVIFSKSEIEGYDITPYLKRYKEYLENHQIPFGNIGGKSNSHFNFPPGFMNKYE